jgi:hypothetical protein
VAPLEPWEKVLVSMDFMDTVHGKTSCIECHGGQQAAEKDAAHTGLIADPSADTQQCATCHSKQASNFSTSLHASLAGYWTVLDARSVPENHVKLEEGFNNHCASCHTTCGDCHISQPGSVGGGLLNGHNFEKTPPMTRTCTACHGSRVGAEYLGKHEDIPGDVHFRQGRMNCVACHKGSDMHAASDESASHRYAGPQLPACTDCHAEVGQSGDQVMQHTLHQDKLSCQVCHSVEYTSCDGCHVAISEKTGSPFFRTERDYLTFFIGKNPRQDEYRPYEWVTLRHIPVAPTSFEYYGENLLPNFNALPTWAYATPHNIQRKTPQNQSCKACHGNADIFLTADKVNPEELEANQPVIVDVVPQMP